jgi:hypothetical protein
MAERDEHSGRRRLFTDTLLGVAALVVSAVSLWIGIRTEQANEHLVAASSWPYLYVESSNANPDGAKIIHMDVVNAGVGPAKAETFEVFWNGKAWPSADSLTQACCHDRPFNPTTALRRDRTEMIVGGVQGTVIRAGETRNFVTLPLASDDADVWRALNDARRTMTYRICYCSVLDECWIGNFGGILPLAGELRPARIKTCPTPKTPFLE